MYEIIIKELKRKRSPINVAVVGSGWFGAGLARELYRIGKIRPGVLIDRIPDKAISVYLEMGIKKDEIALVNNIGQLKQAQRAAKYIVLPSVELMAELKDIDVIYEATGDMLGGAQAALIAIGRGITFITGNFEVDATIGLRLACLAKEKDVLYSGSDGDQPGVLARMIHQVKAWGFEPKIAGNSKGFLDCHQNPDGVLPFVPSHQNINGVCAMADGTKQSFEMASLGNAFGYYPLKRGMHGPTTTKDNLINTFNGIVNLKTLQGAYVDFVLGIKGIDREAGVFVIAHRDGNHVRDDMKFLKKGEGPFYLFFRDHHLCHFEAFSSIAETVLFGIPTFSPRGRYVDVISIAKRELKPGQRLDGIGGYDCYGQVERADIAASMKLLPVGLSEFAIAKKKIAKDTPLTYEMVELTDNIVINLRSEQEQMALA